MINFSKDTGVRVSIATLLAVLLWMGGASWKVFGYVQTIAANTVAIQSVVTSLELSRVDRQIEGFRKERRELKRDLRADPTNDLLLDQLDELDDAIESALIDRECIIDPDKKVCR